MLKKIERISKGHINYKYASKSNGRKYWHSVQPPSPSLLGGGGWASYQMFKKEGGLDRTFLEGGNVFQGGAIFQQKIN